MSRVDLAVDLAALVEPLLAQLVEAISARMPTSGTESYLTVEQCACFLGVEPKTVRNLMHNGTLRRGEHWFQPPGLGPRLKRAALVAWIEAGRPDEQREAVNVGRAYGGGIPRDRPRTGGADGSRRS